MIGPPRKCLALMRPRSIDEALFLFEEHAIVICRMFVKGDSPVDLARVFFYKLFCRNIEELCHFGDFLFIDPYISGSASATFTASSTFKTQALFIPRGFWLSHDSTK